MKIQGYCGICANCFAPIEEGQAVQIRENGRRFHKACALDTLNYYVKLEYQALRREEKKRASLS